MSNNPRLSEMATAPPSLAFRNVIVSHAGAVHYVKPVGDAGTIRASANFPLLIIGMAWRAGCDFESLADGYGLGMGTQGDWSAIRDSSLAATNAMLEESLNFIHAKLGLQ